MMIKSCENCAKNDGCVVKFHAMTVGDRVCLDYEKKKRVVKFKEFTPLPKAIDNQETKAAVKLKEKRKMKQYGQFIHVSNETEIETAKKLLLDTLIKTIKEIATKEDFWIVQKLDGTFPWHEGSEGYSVAYKICVMADDKTEKKDERI